MSPRPARLEPTHYRANGFAILRPFCHSQSARPQHITRDSRRVTCATCLRKLATIADAHINELLAERRPRP